MKTTEFKTFKVEVKDAQAWVTFDYPPVNIQGIPMLEDLNQFSGIIRRMIAVSRLLFSSRHIQRFL